MQWRRFPHWVSVVRGCCYLCTAPPQTSGARAWNSSHNSKLKPGWPLIAEIFKGSLLEKLGSIKSPTAAVLGWTVAPLHCTKLETSNKTWKLIIFHIQRFHGKSGMVESSSLLVLAASKNSLDHFLDLWIKFSKKCPKIFEAVGGSNGCTWPDDNANRGYRKKFMSKIFDILAKKRSYIDTVVAVRSSSNVTIKVLRIKTEIFRAMTLDKQREKLAPLIWDIDVSGMDNSLHLLLVSTL